MDISTPTVGSPSPAVHGGRPRPVRRTWWVMFLGMVAIMIWGLRSADGPRHVEITPPEAGPPLASTNEGDTAPYDAVSRGKSLFGANGCGACHSIDGAERIGPSLFGIWGSERRRVDGSVSVVDEAYVAESIVDPKAHVVPGYTAEMPSYEGLVSTEDLSAFAAYVRALR